MARRHSNGSRWAAALLGALLLSCVDGGTNPDNFDRKPLLANLGEHVILPTYRAFTQRAEALEAATTSLVAAVGTPDEAARRQTARGAWRDAMGVWQEAELMQVGPAGTAGSMTGGESLRDNLYSWPTVNTCRVDQELVARSYENPGFFGTALVNVYGLAAIEYLLFVDAPENSCPPQVTINTNGSWNALGTAEVTRRRAAYARAASAYLATRARELTDRWEPGKGNFLAQLSTAGQSGSVYETARQAGDELFAAMFYLDLKTKDEKLAVPSGLDPACATQTCPAALESRFARHSKENVLANLRAFRKLLVGNAPGEADRPGFDDWLVFRGSPQVAEQLVANTDAAIQKLQAIPGTLEESLAADPAQVRDAHAAIKAITDILKTQFASVLNLRVPGEGAADND